MPRDRLSFADALRAAAGYRRSGLSWAEIGRLVRYDKDRVRTALATQNLADGWGDSSLKSAGGGFSAMSETTKS